jgi:hypothetical protein
MGRGVSIRRPFCCQLRAGAFIGAMLNAEPRDQSRGVRQMGISAIAAMAIASAAPTISTTLPVFEIFGVSANSIDHYPQGKKNCMKWDEDRTFCATGLRLGNVRNDNITFMYLNGKLLQVRGGAPASEFQLLLDTLTLKYGQSTQVDGVHKWYFEGGELIARKIEPKASADFRQLIGCEFEFTSTDNSTLLKREPFVNF